MNPKHLLTILVLASTTLTAAAQSTNGSNSVSSLEQTIQSIKNPAPWLNWGGDLRLRNEYFNNALSFSGDSARSSKFASLHEQDFFRFRGRVWMSLLPYENVALNVRLTAEPREFVRPAAMGTYFKRTGLEARYGIFDTLNVQFKKPFGLPATLTVGRQDISFGDNWRAI